MLTWLHQLLHQVWPDSDQVVREDAQAEMELFDCKLPTANLATFPTI
jgi:hypothetical protein